jgi:hypothetical protein
MSLDVFKANGGAFSMRSLTAAINDVPFVPGRLGQMGLFRERGINTTTAQIEKRNGKLYLVPAANRGSAAARNQVELRDMIPLKTVHLPVEDRLMADEIQDVRAFGSENQLEGLQMKIDERLATMARSLEATKEHLRIGAVKGIVNDADGVTPLYNIFDVFDISQPSEVDFDLDNAAPASGAVRKKCSSVIRAIEDALESTPYTGVGSACSPEFFDDLVDHPECREAYQRWNDGQALRDQSARRSFFYAGIMFEEYRGKVGSVSFVAPHKAHFFPIGVPDLFDMVYAPANWMQAANTIGLPMYAKATPDPKDRWVDLDAQSNPLTYCTRPLTLIPGKRT